MGNSIFGLPIADTTISLAIHPIPDFLSRAKARHGGPHGATISKTLLRNKPCRGSQLGFLYSLITIYEGPGLVPINCK